MENNNPYKGIREKLQHHEETPSANSWRAIESRLDAIKVAKQRRVRNIYYTAAAVAASLLLLVILNSPQNSEVDNIIAQVEDSNPQIEDNSIIANLVESDTIQIATPQNTKNIVANKVDKTVSRAKQPTTATTATNVSTKDINNKTNSTTQLAEGGVSISNQSVSNKKESNDTVESSSKTTLTDYSNFVEDLTTERDVVAKAKRAKRGNAGYALSLASTNALASSSVNANNSLLKSSDKLNLYSGKEPLNYNHKMPISVGLNVEKRWKNNWGLESGLSYTLLRSDYNSLDNKQYGKQELHYIGIPIQATYRFATVGLFGFYAAAGPKIDINVAGKRIESAESDNAKADASAKVRDKVPQFSLLLRTGASCKIIDHLEVYLEPSMAYYIPNNGDMSTLWQDKPISFVLQVGLRSCF